MSLEPEDREPALTGRIHALPDSLLDREILIPQFQYEIHHYLPFYILVELAMLTEYRRLHLLTEEAIAEIANILLGINKETLQADLSENMSDMCFAIERYVERKMQNSAPAWHIDRSRNDIQATVQLMFARTQLLSVIEDFFQLAETLQIVAEKTTEIPMPGYTHYQSAQIITPGFYLAALSEQLGKTITRLLALYSDINECPLGSGAMAGLELEWDRVALAHLLGFRRPMRNALFGVASKEWMILIAAELSSSSIQLGRFVTDLLTWGSSEYRLIDLPDQFAGISSAMPQKKNFPVLERIRGRLTHIAGYHVDIVFGQHNTPFTNLVETAKEGGSNFMRMIQAMRSALTLLTSVSAHLTFHQERARELCAGGFSGGFTLANLLTLLEGIPTRKAQTIVGRYITTLLEKQCQPDDTDLPLLVALCEEQGYSIHLSRENLEEAFHIEHNLFCKATPGSTHPHTTLELLTTQKLEREKQFQEYMLCKQREQAVQKIV